VLSRKRPFSLQIVARRCRLVAGSFHVVACPFNVVATRFTRCIALHRIAKIACLMQRNEMRLWAAPRFLVHLKCNLPN
jgi:hypothetical protein